VNTKLHETYRNFFKIGNFKFISRYVGNFEQLEEPFPSAIAFASDWEEYAQIAHECAERTNVPAPT
jgi:hypothetical protein